MKFEVYCDESRPDLLSSHNPQANYMVLGSLWLRAEDRNSYKEEIHVLRDKHRVGGEFKWQRVSPSRLSFYTDLMDFFWSKGEDLRFRCVAVDHNKVDLVHYHHSDQELGFYKFYYQMLHHWIRDFNEYVIFCDFKTNRRRDRLRVLQRCLNYSNLSAKVGAVQAVRSKEAVLLQLCDVLTGAVAAKLNGSSQGQSARWRIWHELEGKVGKSISHTSREERKFNVFIMDLNGGW